MIDTYLSITANDQIPAGRIDRQTAARYLGDGRIIEGSPRHHVAIVAVIPHANKALAVTAKASAAPVCAERA